MLLKSGNSLLQLGILRKRLLGQVLGQKTVQLMPSNRMLVVSCSYECLSNCPCRTPKIAMLFGVSGMHQEL